MARIISSTDPNARIIVNRSKRGSRAKQAEAGRVKQTTFSSGGRTIQFEDDSVRVTKTSSTGKTRTISETSGMASGTKKVVIGTATETIMPLAGPPQRKRGLLTATREPIGRTGSIELVADSSGQLKEKSDITRTGFERFNTTKNPKTFFGSIFQEGARTANTGIENRLGDVVLGKKFTEEREAFKARDLERTLNEQNKIQKKAEMFAEIRGKQILLPEQRAAQSRIDSETKKLQSQIDKGTLTKDQADISLEKFVGKEQSFLDIRQRQAEKQINLEAQDIFKQDILKAEKSLSVERANETFGRGKFGISTFIVEKTPLKDFIGEIDKGLANLDVLQVKSEKIGKNIFKNDVTIPVKGGFTNINVGKELFSTPFRVQKTGLLLGRGIARSPFEVGTAALIGAGVGAGLTAAGSSIVTSTAFKGVSLGLGATFVGTTAVNVALAPTKTEAIQRIGEGFGVALGAAAGAAVGGTITSKIKTSIVESRPTRIDATVKQKSITKDLTKSIIEGKATRGKETVKFKAEEFDITKGTFKKDITKIIELKGGSKSQIKILQKFKGSSQGLQGVSEGKIAKVEGLTLTKGGKPQKVNLDIFSSGKITGKVGKNIFKSDISLIKSKGTTTTFKIEEILKTKSDFNLAKVLKRVFTLPAKLTLGLVDTSGRSASSSKSITQKRDQLFGIREQIFDKSITKIDPIISTGAKTKISTKFVFLSGGKGLFTPIVPIKTLVVLPTVSGISPKTKLQVGGLSLTTGRTLTSTDFLSTPKSVPTTTSITDFDVVPLTEPGTLTTPKARPRTLSPGSIPRINFPIVPPFIPKNPFVVPKIPIPELGGGDFTRRTRRKKTKGKSKYSASLVAKALNIKGKKPKIATGLNIRPITMR